jgi:hypothetical protein
MSVVIKPGVRPHFIDPSGRAWWLDEPVGRGIAAMYGIEMLELDGRPIGRTPRQDHVADPLVVDPRPIRRLTDDEAMVIRYFIAQGAYAAVAGFETWRGRDRWIYVDVLGVGRDADEAERHGMPVSFDRSWLEHLRMVGDQLALRLHDPRGETAHNARR